jgi:hypothetical protein
VFDLVQIIYWLALSTWFGSVLFIAIAAPIIFRTVREANPVMTNVLSVNLEGQHSTLLAGSIVGQIINVLLRVQLGCGAALLFALLGQWIVLRPSGPNLLMPILRTALYLAAVALLIYDWRVVWPRMWKFRQEYIDHADEPDVANPALDQFNRYQGESTMILRNMLFVLLGMILFSANINRPTIGLPPTTDAQETLNP